MRLTSVRCKGLQCVRFVRSGQVYCPECLAIHAENEWGMK